VCVQVYGSCVDNAVMDRRPSYLCQADGNWYYHAGGCLCLPGYQPNRDLQRCIGIFIYSVISIMDVAAGNMVKQKKKKNNYK